jgi:hypothetical protein
VGPEDYCTLPFLVGCRVSLTLRRVAAPGLPGAPSAARLGRSGSAIVDIAWPAFGFGFGFCSALTSAGALPLRESDRCAASVVVFVRMHVDSRRAAPAGKGAVAIDKLLRLVTVSASVGP